MKKRTRRTAKGVEAWGFISKRGVVRQYAVSYKPLPPAWDFDKAVKPTDEAIRVRIVPVRAASRLKGTTR